MKNRASFHWRLAHAVGLPAMTTFFARVASLALVLAILGGAAESLHLWWHGRSAAVPVVGTVAFALSWLFAWPAGALAQAHQVIHARAARPAARAMLALVVLVVLFALGSWTISPSGRRLAGGYWLLAGCFGVGGTALLSLATQRSSAVRAVGGLISVAAALGLEAALRHHQYGELHSLLFLGVVVSAIPVAAVLAERLPAFSGKAALLVTVLPTLALLLGLAIVDRAFPWWRFDALHRGRVVAATMRIIQKAADWDGDGFSALAWGGDCDDRDAQVFPLAPDPPGGGDGNCNGVDLDGTSRRDLVLGPATGSPALAPTPAPRRVMMFVLDALRWDHFTAEHMPRMHALAERGLRLRRCYAGGAGTVTSVPLMHTPTQSEPAVLATLRRAGVRILDGESALAPLPSAGRDLIPYRRLEVLPQLAIDAAATEPGPFLLWAHLLPIHDHGADKSRTEVPATPVNVPASYKRAVRKVDTALGELWDVLAARGLADGVTWILVADHGEAFGEAGLVAHGAGAADAVLRVPCAMWGPGLPPVAVDQLASQRGLPATLLGLFGLEVESAAAEFLGRSWLRWRTDPGARLQKVVVVRSGRTTSGRVTEGRLLVLVDDRYRFVSAPEEGSFEFFDVRDQDLLFDLSMRQPDTALHYRRLAATVSDEDGYPTGSLSPNDIKRLDDL